MQIYLTPSPILNPDQVKVTAPKERNHDFITQSIYIKLHSFLPSVQGQFLKCGFSHRTGALGVKL